MSADLLLVLLEIAVRGTPLLLLGLIAAFAVRSPSWRHTALVASLAGLLALPVLGAALPEWAALPVPEALRGFGLEPDAAAYGENATPHPSRSASHESISAPARTDDGRPTVLTGGVIADAPSTTEPATVPGPGAPESSLFLVWLAGVAIVAIPVAVGHLERRRIARSAGPVTGAWKGDLARLRRQVGIRRSVRLLQTDRPVVPLTWGLLRPVILLPRCATGWNAGVRRAVLQHELAHVRRWDAASRAVAHLARTLFWFHPLAWLADARLRREQERACDDEVLLRGVQPADYARALVEVAYSHRNPTTLGATLAFANPSRLERRVVAILDPRRRPRSMSRRQRASATLLTLGLLVPLAALKPAQAPPPEPADAPAIDAAPAAGQPAADPAKRLVALSRYIPEPRATESAAAMTPTPAAMTPRGATPPSGRVPEPSPQTSVSSGARDEGPARATAAGNQGGVAVGSAQRADATAAEPTVSGRFEYRAFQIADDHEIIVEIDGDVDVAATVDGIRVHDDGRLLVRGWMLPTDGEPVADRSAFGDRRLEVIAEGDATRAVWYVDGEERPLDDQAREWLRPVLEYLVEQERVADEARRLESERDRLAEQRRELGITEVRGDGEGIAVLAPRSSSGLVIARGGAIAPLATMRLRGTTILPTPAPVATVILPTPAPVATVIPDAALPPSPLPRVVYAPRVGVEVLRPKLAIMGRSNDGEGWSWEGWNDGAARFEVSRRGDVTLAESLDDVALGDDGILVLEEHRDGELRHRVRLRMRDGERKLTWFANGRHVDVEPGSDAESAAREWARDVLARAIDTAGR